MKKKILVFTGSRADYGLLKPLINQISAAKKLQLKLVVSGQHYSKAHGSTYKEIISDNFKIIKQIKKYYCVVILYTLIFF